MISQPITIFSRSSQSRRSSWLKRRSQKPSGSSLDLVGSTTAGLIMELQLSNAYATAFGGNPKVPNPKFQTSAKPDDALSISLAFGAWDLGFPAAQPRAGDRRDSNPQQPEPQSGALPLSYGHQQEGQHSSFSNALCKRETRSRLARRPLYNETRRSRALPLNHTHE
jgi:hypothetical protein